MTTTTPDALDARASTHADCLVCRKVQPTFDRPLADASKKNRPGFEGATLHCRGCETALLTIYVCVPVTA